MLLLHHCFLFGIIVAVVALPPPDGLNLRRAKQITGDGNVEITEKEPPPNLQLRSRMMAAMNSHKTSPEKDHPLSQTLILTKNKKSAVQKAAKTETPPVSVQTVSVNTGPISRLSPEEVRKKFSSSGDEQVNLKVRPVLRTNFVDANGKIVHDVVSVPIRVSDGHIHSISKNSKNATSSSSIVETEKDVNVSFRSSLPLWLI